MRLVTRYARRRAALATLVSTSVLCGAASSASAGVFDGRWVLVQRMTSSVTVPVVGEIEATTTVISMHDLVDKDGRLRGGGRLCKLAIDSGSPVIDTVLPAAFQRSLPPPMLDAAFVIEDASVKLRQARRVVVVGAKLEQPETEALPTRPLDARVFDQDADKQPGVTIRIEGLVNGEMHVVQRSWTSFDGAFLKDGTFGGRLAFGNEQVVLGTTSPFLKDPPVARPVPNKSWFRIARLAGDASCKEALSLAQSYL